MTRFGSADRAAWTCVPERASTRHLPGWMSLSTQQHPVTGRGGDRRLLRHHHGNLLAAEERVGVGHHVLLSIVGINSGQRLPHYAGKREQERLVIAGRIPWSIVAATQFHDFAAMVAGWTERDGIATIAPLLVQPIADVEVGEILAEIATRDPLSHRWTSPDRTRGPRGHGAADARGPREQVRLVPTWRGLYGTSMSGEVLLPGPDARIAPTTFDDWLAAGAK